MRLIDADALQKEHMKYNDGKRLMLIDVAPTVDAVEVVRCENCRFNCNRHIVIKNYKEEHTLNLLQPKKITFCSYGKRREESEAEG